MNFFVTGAAGFLGSALANRLAREGHQVRGLDDLSAGDPARLDPGVLFTRGDVIDRPKLWTLLQDIDCVYHLAARVSVQESVLYPREYNAVNVGGTVSVMEAMRDVGVKRVVLTSSGAVYGDQQQQPLVGADGARPALALRRLQAGGRVLRPDDRDAVGDRDGRAASVQHLRARAASSGRPPAGGAPLPAPGVARRHHRHPRSRRADTRLRLRRRRGRGAGGRRHGADRQPAGDQHRQRR